MPDSPAALLATRLRNAMKDQALNGAGLADRVERLTGVRPSPDWVSRRVNDDAVRFQPLIRISRDLFTLADALDLDPMDLIEDVVRQAALDYNDAQV